MSADRHRRPDRPEGPGSRVRHHPLRRRLRRRHAARRHPVHQHLRPRSATTSPRFPDFPAEIRAPAGTLAGVSGFQVHFASTDIHTPGDALDALVVMNPAALKTNLKDLQPGGILIVNTDGSALTT